MPFVVAPAFASLLSFEFHWQSQPCHGETVSGDALFLETVRCDGQYQLLLIDVMHHGPSAAVIVDHLQNMLLPDPACWNLQPASLLTLLNTWLAPVWDQQQVFVTAQAILLQLDGRLVGSNAAIPDPRHRTTAPSVMTWALPGGTMLGPVMPQSWTEDVRAIGPGEGLLAFSDGVAEAGKPQFGLTRLDAFLTADPLGWGVISRLFTVLQAHVGTGWPADDTTAFWLERSLVPVVLAYRSGQT